MFQSDLRNQRIEAGAMVGSGRGEAKLVVHDVDGLVGPAELVGPRAQGVLQAQAFLMAHHLMRGRLSDVNDRLAGQMLGCNQVGIVHRSPPGSAP
jgi:hypothetical protein